MASACGGAPSGPRLPQSGLRKPMRSPAWVTRRPVRSTAACRLGVVGEGRRQPGLLQLGQDPTPSGTVNSSPSSAARPVGASPSGAPRVRLASQSIRGRSGTAPARRWRGTGAPSRRRTSPSRFRPRPARPAHGDALGRAIQQLHRPLGHVSRRGGQERHSSRAAAGSRGGSAIDSERAPSPRRGGRRGRPPRQRQDQDRRPRLGQGAVLERVQRRPVGEVGVVEQDAHGRRRARRRTASPRPAPPGRASAPGAAPALRSSGASGRSSQRQRRRRPAVRPHLRGQAPRRGASGRGRRGGRGRRSSAQRSRARSVPPPRRRGLAGLELEHLRAGSSRRRARATSAAR